MPRPIWTEAGLALMVMIWGVNFTVVKWALDAFDPLGFNALRHVFAAAFMVAVLMYSGRLTLPARQDVGRIVVLGAVGVLLYQLMFIVGIDRTRAGNASLMLALVPIFLLAFGGRGPGRPRAAWIGALLSVVGVGLVSGGSLQLEGTGTVVGDAILIGAAGVWAAYTRGAEPLIKRYGPIETTAWTLLVGSLGLFLLGIPSLIRQDWSLATPAAWGGVLFSALLSIGVSYLLWYRGVQRLGGPRTAVFSNLTPVVAMATGTFWLGEELTRYSLVGAALVIGGVVLVRSVSASGEAT